MKILFTGGKGLVGSNIIPILKDNFEIAVYDIDEWDITNIETGRHFIKEQKPDFLVNLAAMTDVDACEDATESALKINGDGPGILAEVCEEYDVFFVQLSTDYVFDGKKQTPYSEEDAPNPQSVYGKSKLAGEQKSLANRPSSLIIRSQWIYGDGGENFITKVVKIAREKGSVSVVNDQRGSPTYAKDIALPLKILLENKKSGIYHISNSNSCTWFDFAREIFRLSDMDVKVEPITSDILGRKAKRPSYSVFDCKKLEKDTGIVMRTWQEALVEYMGKKG